MLACWHLLIVSKHVICFSKSGDHSYYIWSWGEHEHVLLNFINPIVETFHSESQRSTSCWMSFYFIHFNSPTIRRVSLWDSWWSVTSAPKSQNMHLEMTPIKPFWRIANSLCWHSTNHHTVSQLCHSHHLCASPHRVCLRESSCCAQSLDGLCLTSYLQAAVLPLYSRWTTPTDSSKTHIFTHTKSAPALKWKTVPAQFKFQLHQPEPESSCKPWDSAALPRCTGGIQMIPSSFFCLLFCGKCSKIQI